MISLVLPAYNPGEQILATWQVLHNFLCAQPRDAWEILFVLDGCTDDSEATLTDLIRRSAEPRIRLLSYSPNRGKGHAVRRGLLEARGEFRIFTDIDLAYGIDDILRIEQALTGGASLAVASRSHPDSILELPSRLLGYTYGRQWQSWVFNRAVRTILPIRQTDTQAGLKGMTASVAEHVLPQLTCDGFGFDCELLLACQRAGISATEIPVRVRYDDAVTTTSGRTGLRMFRELLTIRRAWRNRTLPPLPASRTVRDTRKAA